MLSIDIIRPLAILLTLLISAMAWTQLARRQEETEKGVSSGAPSAR